MVTFLSSAQSVYFNQYFCLMYRTSINFFWFWIIPNHMLKRTLKIRDHQCGAHRHQVARKDQAGCPQA